MKFNERLGIDVCLLIALILLEVACAKSVPKGNAIFSSGCNNESYPTTNGSGNIYAVGTGASGISTDRTTGRTYASFVPAPVAGSVPGLLLVFHGTIDSVGASPPPSGLEPILPPGSPASNGMESNGHFAVLYFNAEIHNDADTTYLYGYNSPRTRAWDQRNPSLNTDVPYIRSVYSAVEKALCFDSAKVVVYGFSAGGFFANNLASFQPIPGVTVRGAGIDHGGLIQGSNFINTSAPQVAGATRIFLNTNDSDAVVPSSMSRQAQAFWSAGGASTKLVKTGSDHVPMDDAAFEQMLGFLSQ